MPYLSYLFAVSLCAIYIDRHTLWTHSDCSLLQLLFLFLLLGLGMYIPEEGKNSEKNQSEAH